MEKQGDLPEFRDVHEAIESGRPFILSRYTKINLATIAQDKIHLIHEALLRNTYINWQIKNEQDLDFILEVIREHKNLDTVALEFTHGGTIYTVDGLAEILQESKIKIIALRRNLPIRIAPLLQALKHSKNLEKITIFFDPVEEEFEPLASALSNENLKHVEVFSNQIPTNFWIPIIPVLSEHKSLANLELWAFGSGGYDAISQVLQRNTSIRELTLSDNQLDPISIEMQKMLNGLKHNTTLKSIYLSKLANEAVDLLSTSLCHNQINITSLRLVYMTLSEDNCRSLNEALKSNTKLTDLELTDCDIEDVKCQLLIDGFLKRTKLTLDGCRLTTASTKPFFEQLKTNKTLTYLTLRVTNIADDSCKFIAEMLTHNTSLKSLSLEANLLEDEGLIYICEAMLKNKTLVDLDVDTNNTFGVAGMTRVKNMLTRNTTLRRFSTYLNSESVESVKLFTEGLKQNTSLNSVALSRSSFGTDYQPLHVAMREVLSVNYALDTVHLNGDTKSLTPFLNRNRQLKSETKFKVAILSHNIAQSREALVMLPRELWIAILSLVTSPGMEPFNGLVATIFNSYEAKVHI